MIKTRTRMLGNLTAEINKFEQNIQEKVLFSGAAAMAGVIYDEAKLNATGIKPETPGIKTGKLHESIYRVYSAEKSNPNRKTYRVSWNKKTAPHGHLIEYGTSRAPAYPFIRPAFDKVQTAIKTGKERMAERLKEVTAKS